ncbi:MAG: hypothetical protein GY862_27035 [Gammaproteobacteria bacterium]|nr:hypothetical protein [Gammaproteobacteria bacterium]MCP5013851.1 hypothetical protein [Ketobacter sp.]
MKAYRIESLAGQALALRSLERDCADMLEAGKRPLIELKAQERSRTVKQNELQRKWLGELAEQGDWTTEEYRAYCKLHIGVPILCEGSEEFAESYHAVFDPLPYETKFNLMKVPFDFPVTRLMTAKQKVAYLDQMFVEFTELGFKLTEPKRKGRA